MAIRFETERRFGARDYDEHYFRGHEARYAEGVYAAREEWVRAYLPESLEGRVLDAGPGIGIFSGEAVQRGADVVAVDFALDALQAVGRSAPHARRACANLEFLPLVADSFSWVLALDVIEHLYEPQRFLVESLRVLRPGGRLLLMTDNARSLSRWKGLRRIFDHLRDRSEYGKALARIREMHAAPSCHVAMYSASEILSMVRSVGFAVVRWDTFPRSNARRDSIVRRATRGISGSCVIVEALKP